MKILSNTIKYIPVLLLIAVITAFTASAKVYGGTSDGITWSIELNTGEMQISGTGEISDYANHTSTPWGRFISLAKNITISDGITSIGNCAFMYAIQASRISLPDSVTHIGDSAFAYCQNLTDITLPSALVSIGANAFGSNKNLTEPDFPATLESIGSYAFSACASLSAADLSKTKISELYEGTFSGCMSLESVLLPETLTSIGDSAFYNCLTVGKDTQNAGALISGLKSINIPASVTKIGQRAFYNCQLLDNMTFSSSPEVSTDTFYNVPQTYTVTFKNRDKSVLSTHEAKINTLPEYNGDKPEIPDANGIHYEFEGNWDRPFEPVFMDTEYTADYTEYESESEITWIVDGIEVRKDTVSFGNVPVFWTDDWQGTGDFHTPRKDGYKFTGWSPRLAPVTKDAVYTAVFVRSIINTESTDITDNDIEILTEHLIGNLKQENQLTEEQLKSANVYQADDNPDAEPSENINIKDLIYLRQYVSNRK